MKDAKCNNEFDLTSLSLDNFTQCKGTCIILYPSMQHSSKNKLSLADVCELGYHHCHSNASCQTLTLNGQPSCSCWPCFEGDGMKCQPFKCPLDHMVCVSGSDSQQCKCEEGFVLIDDGGCSRTGKPVYMHTYF